ncbi:adenosine kinase isoform X1 [Drosophila persimilis]|uniref:Adenosine kinase n=1 Tax=Drosophila pseudoobscura pseudoobscura TaxID=46245 RepID=A0A6I8WC64_DROPS|nr:adenosine kinase isoform X1 [Drosophila persimilis]XP_033241006.1 adenosine kinase isoform X1 [Drosophila pseudoobscura]
MCDRSSNDREGILVGCGNPLLDISAIVPMDFLQKYEMKEDDAILAEERHMPIYRELVDGFQAEFLAGGSVQNSLRIAQWILGQPKVAVFFGCVGEDEYADILMEKARSAGLDVHYQIKKDVPTGTCAVLITGTHRSLCANLAAANNFTIDHLDQPLNKALVDNALYYYISGFFLTVNPPSIMQVAATALAKQRPFLMNLSAPFISQFYMAPLLAVMPYVDIIFGNEAEAHAFATAQGWPTEDLREIGKRLVALDKLNPARPRIAILTQGCDPVLLIQRDSVEEFPVTRLAVHEIVDTNGAGDAFVGGFLSQFVQGKSLDVCIRCGNYAAGHIIKNPGCTYTGEPQFVE